MSYTKKGWLQEEMETPLEMEKPMTKHLHSSPNGGKGEREASFEVGEFLSFFFVEFSLWLS